MWCLGPRLLLFASCSIVLRGRPQVVTALSVRDPAGLGATYDPACLRDPTGASGPGRRDYSVRLRDSASDPARGLGATYDPACLRDPARASGPGRRDYSARLRDSASDPAQGLGAIYDLACLCDLARASGPGRWNRSESLSDSNLGFRVK